MCHIYPRVSNDKPRGLSPRFLRQIQPPRRHPWTFGSWTSAFGSTSVDVTRVSPRLGRCIFCCCRWCWKLGGTVPENAKQNGPKDYLRDDSDMIWFYCFSLPTWQLEKTNLSKTSIHFFWGRHEESKCETAQSTWLTSASLLPFLVILMCLVIKPPFWSIWVRHVRCLDSSQYMEQ